MTSDTATILVRPDQSPSGLGIRIEPNATLRVFSGCCESELHWEHPKVSPDPHGREYVWHCARCKAEAPKLKAHRSAIFFNGSHSDLYTYLRAGKGRRELAQWLGVNITSVKVVVS